MLNLRHIYDFSWCSEIDHKHLPFQCEFNENEILSSYAKGVYDYFDVEKIEEFVAFKGAYEIASLIENYYDIIQKSNNFAVLAYCFENYTSNAYIEDFKNWLSYYPFEISSSYSWEFFSYHGSMWWVAFILCS